MRKSLNKINKKAGFTLLELLVVVAILAAIAGTASIALKDTDARAAAAAHVAMMDELNKGIRTYRVLQKNTLPTRFDSLLTEDGEDPGMLGFVISESGVTPSEIPNTVASIMSAGGFYSMMYIDEDLSGADLPVGADASLSLDCTAGDNITALINSRANAVVAGNIFMTPSANGCGREVTLLGDDDDTFWGLLWADSPERLTGQPLADGASYRDIGENVYLLTGIGPSSSLFDANTLGGMTTVPVYRHVTAEQYSRFIAVWNIGTYNSIATDPPTNAGITAGDQLELIAILDGALDTKEEELGEWDGTRNTI